MVRLPPARSLVPGEADTARTAAGGSQVSDPRHFLQAIQLLRVVRLSLDRDTDVAVHAEAV